MYLIHTGLLEEVFFDILSNVFLFIMHFPCSPWGGGGQGSKAPAEKAPLHLHLGCGEVIKTQPRSGDRCLRSPVLPILKLYWESELILHF